MTTNTIVSVLGGGIVGICSALALTEAGCRVVLIDKQQPGQGASYGNAGVISPWSVVPQSVPGLWRHIPGWLLRTDGPVAIRPSYLPTLLPWGLKFLKQGSAANVSVISEAMSELNQTNVALYKALLKSVNRQDLISDSYYVHAFRQEQRINLNAPDYLFS